MPNVDTCRNGLHSWAEWKHQRWNGKWECLLCRRARDKRRVIPRSVVSNIYRRGTTVNACIGCGRQTNSLVGYCSLDPKCRTIGNRLRARATAARAVNRRNYVRTAPLPSGLEIYEPLKGLTVSEYERRISLVEKILDHKNSNRTKVKT